MLTLLFSPSTYVLLGRTWNYIWICTTFRWDQTQFHRSSTPVWLLVGLCWGQRGCSTYIEKVEALQGYPMSHFFPVYIFTMLCTSIASWFVYFFLITQYVVDIIGNINQASLGSLCFSLMWLSSITFIVPFLGVLFCPSASISFYLCD